MYAPRAIAQIAIQGEEEGCRAAAVAVSRILSVKSVDNLWPFNEMRTRCRGVFYRGIRQRNSIHTWKHVRPSLAMQRSAFFSSFCININPTSCDNEGGTSSVPVIDPAREELPTTASFSIVAL